MNPEVAGPIGVAFVLAVLFPISLAYARRIWRRSTAPAAVAPRESPESAQRLARLEEAVDAIAVEVERISEGQRFMTKIMVGQRSAADVAAAAAAEAGPAPRALGAGEAPAETIKVGGKEAVPVANIATQRS